MNDSKYSNAYWRALLYCSGVCKKGRLGDGLDGVKGDFVQFTSNGGYGSINKGRLERIAAKDH